MVCLAPLFSSLKSPQIASCDRRTYTLCAQEVPRFPGSISQNAFKFFDTRKDASLSLCVQSLSASPSGVPRQPLVIQRAGYMKPSSTVISCKTCRSIMPGHNRLPCLCASYKMRSMKCSTLRPHGPDHNPNRHGTLQSYVVALRQACPQTLSYLHQITACMRAFSVLYAQQASRLTNADLLHTMCDRVVYMYLPVRVRYLYQ